MIQDWQLVDKFTKAVRNGDTIEACSAFQEIVSKGIKATFKLQGISPIQQKKQVRQKKALKKEAHRIAKLTEKALGAIKQEADNYFKQSGYSSRQTPQPPTVQATQQPSLKAPQYAEQKKHIVNNEVELISPNPNEYKIRRFTMPSSSEPLQFVFLGQQNFKLCAQPSHKIDQLLKKRCS